MKYYSFLKRPHNYAFASVAMIQALFISIGVFTLSCAKTRMPEEKNVTTVQAAEVIERNTPDTVSGFGALSFHTKVDIAAPQDGKVGRLYYREGDRAAAGSAAVQLINPQIRLAVQKAEDGFSQAAAAFRLAKARLSEGEYAAEAEILGIAKAEAEFTENRRSLEEERRKQNDAERLYEAGGISREAIRESRFSFESAEERLRLMERELEIRRIGLRDRDLAGAGLAPENGFPSPEARRTALIHLSTRSLRAEAEAAAARLEAAGRERESAKLAFSELTVISPASGIVGARHVEEGEQVKRDDKLLTIMDTGSLYAICTLRESDALRLRKGMSAVVNVDGTGKSYRGTVDLVSPQADSQSFTFSIRILISAESNKTAEKDGLHPGMFARVLINTETYRNYLAIPDRAIINKHNDGGIVFVILNGKVSERNISFGKMIDGEREVLSGLSPGEKVAVNPGPSLKEGSRVIPEK
jgi:RND family efflux transporter MFP subunit